MRREDVKQIYVSKDTGERLKDYCKEKGFIMTMYADKVVDEHLKSLGK